MNVAIKTDRFFSVWKIKIRSESIIGNKVTIWAIVDFFLFRQPPHQDIYDKVGA
jgi:hypothetical protein